MNPSAPGILMPLLWLMLASLGLLTLREFKLPRTLGGFVLLAVILVVVYAAIGLVKVFLFEIRELSFWWASTARAVKTAWAVTFATPAALTFVRELAIEGPRSFKATVAGVEIPYEFIHEFGRRTTETHLPAVRDAPIWWSGLSDGSDADKGLPYARAMTGYLVRTLGICTPARGNQAAAIKPGRNRDDVLRALGLLTREEESE